MQAFLRHRSASRPDSQQRRLHRRAMSRPLPRYRRSPLRAGTARAPVVPTRWRSDYLKNEVGAQGLPARPMEGKRLISVTPANCGVGPGGEAEKVPEECVALANKKSGVGQELCSSHRSSQWDGRRTNNGTER
jgi:hypothetical protein